MSRRCYEQLCKNKWEPFGGYLLTPDRMVERYDRITQGGGYFAKEGFVMQFKKSIRGNNLVDQSHEEDLVGPGPAHLARMSEKNRYIPKSE